MVNLDKNLKKKNNHGDIQEVKLQGLICYVLLITIFWFSTMNMDSLVSFKKQGFIQCNCPSPFQIQRH